MGVSRELNAEQSKTRGAIMRCPGLSGTRSHHAEPTHPLPTSFPLPIYGHPHDYIYPTASVYAESCSAAVPSPVSVGLPC